MAANVSDVMTRGVETIESTATLEEAAQKMRDFNVGALPVYTGRTLIGFVTDRDITVKATAKGLSPSTGTVEEAMTWRAAWCWEDADIEEAARIMERKAVRRLAVLNHSGELVGILSLDDIATRAHDSAIVEKILEAASSREALNSEVDDRDSFDQGVVD